LPNSSMPGDRVCRAPGEVSSPNKDFRGGDRIPDPWPSASIDDSAGDLSVACAHAEKLSALRAALGVTFAQQWLGRLLLSRVSSVPSVDGEHPPLLYLGPAALCTGPSALEAGSPLDVLFRDSVAFDILEGTGDMMRLAVARGAFMAKGFPATSGFGATNTAAPEQASQT
jgi:hypothetical protein